MLSFIHWCRHIQDTCLQQAAAVSQLPSKHSQTNLSEQCCAENHEVAHLPLTCNSPLSATPAPASLTWRSTN